MPEGVGEAEHLRGALDDGAEPGVDDHLELAAGARLADPDRAFADRVEERFEAARAGASGPEARIDELPVFGRLLGPEDRSVDVDEAASRASSAQRSEPSTPIVPICAQTAPSEPAAPPSGPDIAATVASASLSIVTTSSASATASRAVAKASTPALAGQVVEFLGGAVPGVHREAGGGGVAGHPLAHRAARPEYRYRSYLHSFVRVRHGIGI